MCNYKISRVFLSAVFLSLIASNSWAKGAEDQKWSQLYQCVDKHAKDVARVVLGLEEGSKLIMENLCQNETTELVNTMVKERKETVAKMDNIGDTFSSFR